MAYGNRDESGGRSGTGSRLIQILLIVAVVLGVLTFIVTVFNLRFFKDSPEVVVINGQGNATDGPAPPPPAPSSTTPAPSPTIVGNSPGYQAAAKLLLANVNTSVDPCQDFYSFSCDNYIAKHPVPEGYSYVGAFGDTQMLIIDQIVTGVNRITDVVTRGDAEARSSLSKTEKIVANVYQQCLKSEDATYNQTLRLQDSIQQLFGGFPVLDEKWSFLGTNKFFSGIAQLEMWGVSSFFESFVSVDEEHVKQNALYFSQFPMALPREFYVEPQFLRILDSYLEILVDYVSLYASATGANVTDAQIRRACQDVVHLEVRLALASVPDNLLRNYELQYNQYNQRRLAQVYRHLKWRAYFGGLGIQPADDTSFVVSEPTYFGVLDTVLSEQPKETLVNLAVTRFIIEYSVFIADEEARKLRARLHALLPPRHMRTRRIFRAEDRRQHIRVAPTIHAFPREVGGVTDEQQELARYCAIDLVEFMPHAAAYIYLRDVEERDAVKADITLQTNLIVDAFLEMVTTLPWISAESLAAVHLKCKNLVKNIGWPDWFDFGDASTLDAHHTRYTSLEHSKDYLEILLGLNVALQYAENFDDLSRPPNRHQFFGSAAIVNAWYIPELNSITFPYGILNPPFYRLDFPQYFNYAGQGGTAGHELSHGFDDEGVQFGPTGELSDCKWNRCGWMDRNSTFGFLDMAQCVVSQYSNLCCPIEHGPIRCANGATTQGENIADLAGEQAAYRAYRNYVAHYRSGVEEARLPGLEQYTPNQLFWIAYGATWCSNTVERALVNQILVDPHAPDSCRVNQVVRDIPEFGRDFGCAVGTPMFPAREDRCPVWVGGD